jgi:hypothetical protein
MRLSAPQKTYRVYMFDLHRRAVSADFITAASDEDAIAAAEASDFGHKCEIWEQRRLVAQLGGERRTG